MVIIVVEAEEELGDDDRDGLGDQSTEEEEDALGEGSVTAVRAFRLVEGGGIAERRGFRFEPFWASNLGGAGAEHLGLRFHPPSVRPWLGH